jgi:drug/metabolite transporter (DMT)-like permease
MATAALYGVVLLSAILHASWNALLKGAGDRLLTMVWMRLVGLLIGALILCFVEAPAPQSWPWLGAAAAAHYLYYGLLIRSYAHGDLSLVYPIARGLAPLLLALMAYLFIAERLSVSQAVATGLIALGLLALVSGEAQNRKAIWFASATGATIAIYSFLGGAGVRLSESILGFYALLEISTGIGMIGYALLWHRDRIAPFARKGAVAATAAGAISALGYLIFLFAATMPLAPVAAVRETSVVFGTVIGALFLKESFGPRRVLAAALVTCGILGLAAFGAGPP